MIWWLTAPSRARAERAAIAELEERSPWLAGISWGFESELRLTADFTIRHLDDEFQLRLVYPSFFPDTPPQVLPREKIRLSRHQWGVGGELCLELRADNWDPSFTGAMMIESAYNLLSGERPSDEERAEVPSAHRVSQAQSIRGDKLRFLITAEERVIFQELPTGEAIELALSEHHYNKHWLIHPTRLGPLDEPVWTQPQRVIDGRSRQGFAIRLPSAARVPGALDEEVLRAFLESIGAGQLLEQRDPGTGELFILFVESSAFKLLCTFPGKEKRLVLSYTTVELPERRSRLPESHATLADKSVAIVGCGSVGSKVVASLARSGVRKFVLIDEDILNPDNLVRNDLDARAVGMHKVDGVAARVLDFNLEPGVSMRRIKLGGQESAASTDSAMGELAACDLIIDATADPQVFNLCASVARNERKPMVWGEVFAGGIGGLVVRVRPELEPPPHAARRQLSAWCDKQGVLWERQSVGDYGVEQGDAPPVVADDADVTVIAGHVARLALDTLVRGADSQFPYSAYAIGIAKGWIFSAPFDTAPIEFSAEGSWGPDRDPDAAEQLNALAAEIFPSVVQETDAT